MRRPTIIVSRRRQIVSVQYPIQSYATAVHECEIPKKFCLKTISATTCLKTIVYTNSSLPNQKQNVNNLGRN